MVCLIFLKLSDMSKRLIAVFLPLLFTCLLYLPQHVCAQPFVNTQNDGLDRQVSAFYSVLAKNDFDADRQSLFYANAIFTFFDTVKMNNRLRESCTQKDNLFLLTFQSDILKRVDSFIHVISPDSIFVINASTFFKTGELTDENAEQMQNHLFGGVTINGEMYPLLNIEFDNSSKRFVVIMPVIYFDAAMGQVIGAFIKRQREKIKRL
jgi:hypothetical protein